MVCVWWYLGDGVCGGVLVMVCMAVSSMMGWW